MSLKTMDQDSFPCTVCDMNLRSLVKLQTHLLKKHGKTMTIEQKCPECFKIFKSRKRLRAHMINHTADKRYKCQFCDKRFYRTNHLKSHSMTHSKDSLELLEFVESKKVDCSDCGKTLRDQQCLKSHIINIHTSEKPHKCEECGKKFKMGPNLTVHKLTHTGRYSCDNCKTRFHSKVELQKHADAHQHAIDEVGTSVFC